MVPREDTFIVDGFFSGGGIAVERIIALHDVEWGVSDDAGVTGTFFRLECPDTRSIVIRSEHATESIGRRLDELWEPGGGDLSVYGGVGQVHG